MRRPRRRDDRRPPAWPPPTSSSPTTGAPASTSSSTRTTTRCASRSRRFVSRELAPHAEEWEETTFPDWVFQRMGELGFLGLSMPEEYGGQGGDYYCNIVLGEEMTGVQLRRRCDGHRGPHRHGHAAGPPLRHRGAEAALPRAGDRGRRRSPASAITEPDAGSDVAGIKTRAVRDGDDYVINGSQDLHHQRPPGRLHRAGDEDRPGRRLRRLHAVPRRHGLPGRDPREEAREARHARLRHRAARLPGRPRAGRRRARRGRQGLLPHHVGAPGRAADRRRGLRRRRPALLRPHARSTPRSARPSAARSGTSR